MDLDTFLKDHVAKGVRQTTFFHFTDTRNLDLIKKHGILSRRKLREMCIDIPAPGGNQWSRDAADRLELDRYVSLCLTPSHPMEFLARKGGQIKEATYLPIRPDIIKAKGVMMTGGVSNKSGIVPEAPGEVLEKLDIEAIYRPQWGDRSFIERLKVAEKFEILVPDQVPVDYILKL
jgi:ssDNA thymidine ADP-ribosyltransferase, DarT